MKTIIKLTLVLSLFGSVALADGDMGSGNYRPCTVDCPPPCTVNCVGSAQLGDENMVPAAETTGITTDLAIDFVKDTLEFLF